VTLNYGTFLNTLLTFLIVAACVFLLVRAIAKLYPAPAAVPAPKTKECPFCKMPIPIGAVRCPDCTSQVA
jgi:large conductance mechanosensitive channel